MRFFADEGVDAGIVSQLRDEGHEVSYAAETTPGASDEDLLRTANAAGALLLTADKDFGELVFRLGRIHSGVVLLRVAGLSAAMKRRIVASAVEAHGPELENSFTVISPGSVRIRRRL